MSTLAYVSNANKVSIIDASTNTVVNSVIIEPADNFAKLIAITPDGRFAYVTNQYYFATVIDTCTNSIIATIPVGNVPTGIAVTPNGRYVYVANSGLATATSGSVSVIDTNTNTVVKTIPVGRDPIGIAITPDGSFAYVTIGKADSVSVIDTATNEVVKNITVGDLPVAIAITPSGSYAYVANQGQSALTNTVSVIDTSTNTVVDTITVGIGPSSILITPDGNFAYVANVFDNNVSVIDTDTNEVVQTIPVGSGPVGTSITPDGNFVYVTNFISNSVSVIDTTINAVVDTIPNLSRPVGIATANITPCPTPSDKMCIETTRIFDSCAFEEQQHKTFNLPNSNEYQCIHCKVIETKYSILDITKTAEEQDLVNVNLRIEVMLGFISNCSNDPVLKRTVYFDKNTTLTAPEGSDISCDINSATCECVKLNCGHKLTCTVEIAAVVKSKKLVQIQIPFLGNCQSKQCCSCEGISIAPGKSLTLSSEPSQINRIKFAAKTSHGMTSQLAAFLNTIPFTSKTVTEQLKPFEINLPGGPFPVENISLRNLGKSTIYIYKLTTE